MGNTAVRSFGTYMRTLRERAGLARPDACRLFGETAESIDRGSLWRLENGEHGMSIGKIGTLGRIYGVPMDVIFERWELDRQFERLDLEDGHAPTFEQKVEAGRKALAGMGTKWQAYGHFRDALEGTATEADSLAIRLNLATAMRSLGKNRLALHELQELESEAPDSPLYPVVLDRIANCRRCLGDLAAAGETLAAAREIAEAGNDMRVLGVIHSSEANLAIDREEAGDAVEHIKRAIRVGHDPKSSNGALRPSPGFEGAMLNMLADAQLTLGRYEPAKRSALSAGKIGRRYGIPTCIAYSELMLGRLEEKALRPTQAALHWREVDAIARAIGNRRLRFAAAFYSFRHSVRTGETSRAELARRRLERLRPGVSDHFPLVRKFRDLQSDAPTGRRRRPGKRPSRPEPEI